MPPLQAAVTLLAQRLKAGTEIMLTVTGGQPTKVRLLCADDTILLTLKACGFDREALATRGVAREQRPQVHVAHLREMRRERLPGRERGQ